MAIAFTPVHPCYSHRATAARAELARERALVERAAARLCRYKHKKMLAKKRRHTQVQLALPPLVHISATHHTPYNRSAPVNPACLCVRLFLRVCLCVCLCVCLFVSLQLVESPTAPMIKTLLDEVYSIKRAKRTNH